MKFPLVIHYAILGSLERFLSLLLKLNNNKLPLWFIHRPIIWCGRIDDQSSFDLIDKSVEGGIVFFDSIYNIGAINKEFENKKYIVVSGEKEELNHITVKNLHDDSCTSMKIHEFVKLIQEENHFLNFFSKNDTNTIN